MRPEYLVGWTVVVAVVGTVVVAVVGTVVVAVVAAVVAAEVAQRSVVSFERFVGYHVFAWGVYSTLCCLKLCVSIDGLRIPTFWGDSRLSNVQRARKQRRGGKKNIVPSCRQAR